MHGKLKANTVSTFVFCRNIAVDLVGDQYYSQIAEKATTDCHLNEFLRVTQSQMTYSGLFALQEAVPENTISILFRNNHFHTLYRRNNHLYLLATDEGFLGQKAVWEVIENIDGSFLHLIHTFQAIPTGSIPISSHSNSRQRKKLRTNRHRPRPHPNHRVQHFPSN